MISVIDIWISVMIIYISLQRNVLAWHCTSRPSAAMWPTQIYQNNFIKNSSTFLLSTFVKQFVWEFVSIFVVTIFSSSSFLLIFFKMITDDEIGRTSFFACSHAFVGQNGLGCCSTSFHMKITSYMLLCIHISLGIWSI